MPVASQDGVNILVDASYREKQMMQSIPGARFRDNQWQLPLSWASCQSLRGSFPDTLDIHDSLASWAVSRLPDIERLESLKLKDGNEYPFAYQDIASEFMFRNNVLLADEMGLGKSKEVIDTIVKQAYRVSRYSILIVCPNTLKYVWKSEWAKWAPDWDVHVLDGNLPKKRKILEAEAGVFIINYESLRSLSRLSGFGSIHLTEKEKVVGPLNRKWTTVVLDEAHKIKDPRSKQTRAAWAIGETADQRLALTGTPIANTPVDLWPIMHFIEPQDWPSRTKFIDRYCLTSYNYFGGLEVVGLLPRSEKEFFNILNPHFLRRTKAEVLKSLPDKTYQTRYLTMPTKQSKVYADMHTRMIAELDSGVLFTTSPLVKATRLVQMASGIPVLGQTNTVTAFEQPSCKVEAILEILDEAPGDQLVVFAVNVPFVTMVMDALEKAHIKAVRVTGAESAEDRADAVAAFEAREAQVIVLTAATGGEGITLTSASRLVFAQMPWSNVQHLQAQDRVHRQGQTRGVQIIYLVSQNTIEESVMEVLADKDFSLQELCKDPQWVKKALG